MIFTAWLPLAYAGTDRSSVAGVSGRASGAGELRSSRRSLPLVVAAVAGGFLVGRFGKPAGAREALLAGLVTGLVAVRR